MTPFTVLQILALLATAVIAFLAWRERDTTVIACAALLGASLALDLSFGDNHPILLSACHLAIFVGLATLAASPVRLFTLPLASAALLSLMTLAMHAAGLIASQRAAQVMLGAWDLIALAALVLGSLAANSRVQQ